MISQTISNRNENPLISAFWIPLLALPIISFLTNHNEIPRGVIPQTFYQHQLDYFDHRNAVITYWDMVASNTNNEDLLLEYSSEHKSNKTIEVNLLDNHVYHKNNERSLKLSLGNKQSNWSLSTHPRAIQLPRVHKLSRHNSTKDQAAFQIQLSWYTKLNWLNTNASTLSKLSKLAFEINDLQHDKTLVNITHWAKLQEDLQRLISKIKQDNLVNILTRYLSYQKSLLLLELASHINQFNITEVINIILKFDLLDSLTIDETDLFSIPVTSRAFELNVILDPTKTDQYRNQVISELSSSAQRVLESFDLKNVHWQCITALARTYQFKLLNPNTTNNERAQFKSKIKQLLSPNSKNSLAYKRSSSHPDGADFRIKDSYYSSRKLNLLEHNLFSITPLNIDFQDAFSDSIQTIKLNDSHYVIDTFNRDCFQLIDGRFSKISRLPHDINPLAQAVVQPDPQLGQPRVFIFGGFPSNNTAYTSNNLIQFKQIDIPVTIEGRFYFGMTQYKSNLSGLEKTLIIGGTKGRQDDLARFQDIHSSIDGINWNKTNTIDWASRHSFGLSQLGTSLIAFGGCRYFEKGKCFNEVWSSNDGKDFQLLTKTPWKGRGGMAYAISPIGLLMFGGADETQVFSDLWITSDGKSWKQIPISTIGSVNSQLIITNNRLWIIGGKTQHNRYAPTRSFRITKKAIQFL